MSGLKSRQRPLLGDSALAIVDIGHKNAERALAETWLHEPRLAEPLGVATAVKVGSADSIADFIPELQAVRARASHAVFARRFPPQKPPMQANRGECLRKRICRLPR